MPDILFTMWVVKIMVPFRVPEILGAVLCSQKGTIISTTIHILQNDIGDYSGLYIKRRG